MKKIMSLLYSASCVCLLNSCYYDNFKELHPESALPAAISVCDTSGIMSYSLQIVPILNSACTQSCHNGIGTGHDMRNYTAVNADAVSNKLYSSVAQDGNAQAMPQNGTKLSECDITKIKNWVKAGAPNN